MAYLSLLEEFVLTDAISTIASFKTSLTENNVLVDSILSSHTALRQILQDFSLTDSVSKYSRIARSEVLHIVEQFDRSIEFALSILDLFDILDFILPGGTSQLLIDEVITIADMIANIGYYNRQSLEELSIVDSLSTFYSLIYALLIEESVQLQSILSSASGYILNILETSNLLDYLRQGLKLDIRLTRVEVQFNGIRKVLTDDYERLVRVFKRRRKIN